MERVGRSAAGTPLPLPSPATGVRLWWAALDPPFERLAALYDHLDAEERARAARYCVPVVRRRFVAARGILRELLGACRGKPPAQLHFSPNAWGKPELEGGPYFNLAHNGDLALYAVAERIVGIDVERVRPLENLEGLAKRFFSPAESEALQALPPTLRLRAFFTTWVRKEAYVKARGEGLRYPLKAFDVPVSPTAPPRLLEDRHAGDSERWTFHDLRIPLHCGALVVRQRDEG
ncbi:MAG: 4'-phosphopantetheinyl transferase family protein, partial [Anaerolineales bacterium]